ncbi:MAG: glycosyltransferase family 4 protein [Mycobacteriales bacterium]
MTADTVGGVWTYCVELAHALDAEVHLATMGRPMTPAQRDEAAVFASVTESDFPLEWEDRPWDGVDAAGDWLLALEAELRPDVVHLNGYAHGVLPFRAPTVVVAHSDVLSWWRQVRGEGAGPDWDEYRRRVTAGLAAAGTVVAPTAAVAGDLRREYGHGRTVVVPNCRRPELLPSADKEPFVLAAGRVWDQAKGLSLLGSLDVPVRVAGEGRLPAVETLGPLPFGELAALMARAQVFAAPARYEPFGLAALEAAHAGCALVLGDIPSLREVWGDAARYCSDAGTLRTEVAAALADPEAGLRAREHAQHYLPTRTAAGYRDVYARLPIGTS